MEIALLAPFLVLLLLGGAQVGEIGSQSVAQLRGTRGCTSWSRGAGFGAGMGCRWNGAVKPPMQLGQYRRHHGESTLHRSVEARFLDPTSSRNPCASGQGCITITVSARTTSPPIRCIAPRTADVQSPCNNGQYATVKERQRDSGRDDRNHHRYVWRYAVRSDRCIHALRRSQQLSRRARRSRHRLVPSHAAVTAARLDRSTCLTGRRTPTRTWR